MKLVVPKSIYPFIGILILLFLVELFTPTPIDWTQNFNSNDKRPYGSYLLVDLLKTEFFPNRTIEHETVPVFNYEYEEDESVLKNYIYITNHLDMKDWDAARLIELVEQGNQIFIAASSIGKALEDTLKLSINTDLRIAHLTKNTRIQSFENEKIYRNKTFNFEKAFDPSFIDKFTKDSLIVLGRNSEKEVQLIKKKIGKGNLFLSCQPLAFTNYNILSDNNAEYIAGAFSYLPNYPIVWDEYYKPMRAMRSSSPLKYLLVNPPLRLAFYLLFFSLVFLLIFQGKRQQQIIPIIEPLRNTSLDFIRTLGALYYTSRNHKDIADKKIKHFKEFIRSKYHTEFAEKNLHELSVRSGIALKTLQILHQQAKSVKELNQLTQEGLEDFHSKIEYIYDNCK